MPSIAFPPAPANGEQYTFAGLSWAFNGTGWRQKLSASENGFNTPTSVTDYREQTPGIPALAFNVAMLATAITYI